MPAVLRQLQIIETQRCESLAASSLQFATMQLKLYQHALDTNWKDLVLVNTFSPAQDINAFVAFTSTGAKCPPPPLPAPDTILSPSAPPAASSSASRLQGAAAQPSVSPSPPPSHPLPAPQPPTPLKTPLLPPKTADVDGKVGQPALCRAAPRNAFLRPSSPASAAGRTVWSSAPPSAPATASCAATWAL